MYRMVLFDVDGVLLSEERCFDSSALSVWELLYSSHGLQVAPGFTTQPSEEMMGSIRSQVFVNNQVLDWMKKRGINANWDMVYLAFTAQLMLLLRQLAERDRSQVQDWLIQPITESTLTSIREWMEEESILFEPDFAAFPTLFPETDEAWTRERLLVSFNEWVAKWFDVEVTHFSRNSALWELCRSVYQEWYLGETLFAEVEGQPVRARGKRGFLSQEIPLAAPPEIGAMLGRLAKKGITLGIGTGRPAIETEVPLKELNLYAYFSPDRIVSATDVVRAEEAYPEKAPLGKPEPYTYIKGYLGRDRSEEEYLKQSLPLADGNQILIVGDSMADFLAARRMGCHFAATLTGLTGQQARSQFEEVGAEYILDDVLQLEKIFD